MSTASSSNVMWPDRSKLPICY